MSKRTICYFCGVIPFELFLPFDISLVKASANECFHNTYSSVYFPSYMCSYALSCLEQTIESDYDGFVFTNKCHAMIALYELYRERFPDKLIIMLNTPNNLNELSIKYYREELKRVFLLLSERFDYEPSIVDLERSFFKISDIQKSKLDTKGRILRERCNLSVDILNRIDLTNTIEVNSSFKKTDISTYKRLNLVLGGMIVTPINLLELLEELGANIIGFYSFDHLESEIYLSEDTDIFYKIACKYIRLFCKDDLTNEWNNKRKSKELEHLIGLDIKGVILSLLKFCPIQSYSSISVTETLKKENIPVLVINDSFAQKCSAQLHTRIQAFIEQIS